MRRNKVQQKQKRFYTKQICISLVLVLAANNAHTNPIGAAVVNGQASFAAKGNTLTVTNTPGTIINWQGFSIGANEITRFAQQSASSAVLNRVISNNPSSILGSLQSNGRVFLVNPNGIVFGANSTVNVAGMVASTLNLSNADFLAGRYNFTNVPGAQNISNAGSITAQNGGQVYLIAPNVENTGIINAPSGEILLVAGQSVELVNSNVPNLRVNITAPAGNATNIGQLVASSGSLGIYGTIVKNSGTVNANGATMQGGKIVLKASQRVDAGGTISATGATGGTIEVLGSEVLVNAGAMLDASGTNGGGTVLVGGDAHGTNPNVQNALNTYVDATATIKADATQNGNGGKVVVWSDNTTQFNGNISAQGGTLSGNGGWVEVSGKQKLGYAGLTNTLAAKGLAGSLLLDPADFIIAAAGGDMTGATLSTQLGLANVTITTALAGATVGLLNGGVLGDITVNDIISWVAPTTLTLNAYGSIYINSAITGGPGSLILNAGGNALGTAVINESVTGSMLLASLVANSPGGTTLSGANSLGSLDAQTGGLTGTGVVNVATGGSVGLSNTMAGTLNVAGGTLITNGAWRNLGTLNLTTGVLNLSGVFTNVALGTNLGIFTRTGGTVNLSGMLTNTGVLDIGSAGLFKTGGLNSLTGTILGGTLVNTDAVQTALNSSLGWLDGVTIGSNFTLSGATNIANNLTLATGTTLNLGTSTLYFNTIGAQSIAPALAGTATVTMAGGSIYQNVAAQTLTLGAGLTVNGSGLIGSIPVGVGNSIVNNGIIDGNNPALGSLQIQGDTLTNNGTMRASTLGSLVIAPTTNFTNSLGASIIAGAGTSLYANNAGNFTNAGTITLGGVTHSLGGALSLTNTGSIALNAGDLSLGGTLTVANLNPLNYTRAAGTTVGFFGTLNNTAATLDIGSAGLFGVGGLNGFGGKILGGTLMNTDAVKRIDVTGGVLDGVTISSNLTLSCLNVGGCWGLTGLQINNGLTLANGVTLNIGAHTLSTNLLSLGISTPGAATITMAGGSIHQNSGGGSTTTLGAGLTVNGYGSLYAFGGLGSGTSFTNNGIIDANVAGQTINVSYDIFTNNGTLRASAGRLSAGAGTSFITSLTSLMESTGGNLEIGSSLGGWSNLGTINLTAGSLSLGGNFTTATLGTGLGIFNRTAGTTVNFAGTLTNTAANLDIGSAGLFKTGGLNSYTGTILGGILVNTDLVQTALSNVGLGTLDGVTIGSNLALLGSRIANNLTLANGTTLNLGNGWLYFITPGAQSIAPALGGAATVNMAGGNIIQFDATSTQTLTLGAGLTLNGYGSINNWWAGNIINNGIINANVAGQVLNVAPNVFTNSATGLLEATGGTLSIAPTGVGNWSNLGTINLAAGALDLGGTFTAAGLGIFNRTAGTTVNLSGKLTNTGATLDIGSAGLFKTGGLTTLFGTILGGTLINTDVVQTALASYGWLDGVTIGTNLALSGNLFSPGGTYILNNLTLANGTTLNLGNSTLWFNTTGAQSLAPALAGTATINMAGGNIAHNNTAQTLTLGAGLTVNGYGWIGNPLFGSVGNNVVNNGIINANVAGQALAIHSPTFTNNGTLRASVGSGVTPAVLNIHPLSAFISGATGILEASNGGALNLLGTVAVSTPTLNLNGGFVSGNLASAARQLTVTSALNINSSSSLSNITLNALGATAHGSLATGAATLILENGAIVNNSGIWTMANGSSILQGTSLTPTAFNNLAAGTLTVPALGTGHLAGTVFTNAGLLNATNATGLVLGGTNVTAGFGTLDNVAVINNSIVLDITGSINAWMAAYPAISLINSATGTLLFNDPAALTPVTLPANMAVTNNGLINIMAGTLTMNGTYTGNAGSSVNIGGGINGVSGILITPNALTTPMLTMNNGMLIGTGVAPVAVNATTLSFAGVPSFLDNITLNALGATTQGSLAGGATVVMKNGATINNSGAWTMENGSSIIQGTSLTPTAFNNQAAGTLSVTALGTAHIAGTAFTNAGTLNATNATGLVLGGANVTAGFGSLDSAAVVTNSGIWEITGINGAGMAAYPSVSLVNNTSGTILAYGMLAPTILPANIALTNNGMLDVSGALSLNGALTNGAFGTVNVASIGSLSLSGAAVNNGTVVIIDGGFIDVASTGSLTNNGVINLNSSSMMAQGGSIYVTGMFTNAATGVINSIGSGVPWVSGYSMVLAQQSVTNPTVFGTLVNNGTVNVNANTSLVWGNANSSTNTGAFNVAALGNLNISDAWMYAAASTIPAGATWVYSGALTNNGFVSMSGGGSWMMGGGFGGTLTYNGTVANNGQMMLGDLNLNGAYTGGAGSSLSIYGKVSTPNALTTPSLTIDSGSLVGTGVVPIAVNATTMLALSGVSTLSNITLNAQGTTTQSGQWFNGVTNVPGGSTVMLENGASINNSGAWTMDNGSSIIQLGAVATSFNNLAAGSLTVAVGKTAHIAGSTFSNLGTLNAINATGLILGGTNVATGVGTLNNAAVITNSGMGVWNIAGFNFAGLAAYPSVSIVNDGAIAVWASGGLLPATTLPATVALTNNGSLQIGGGYWFNGGVGGGSLNLNGAYTGGANSSIFISAGGTLATATPITTPNLYLEGGTLRGLNVGAAANPVNVTGILNITNGYDPLTMAWTVGTSTLDNVTLNTSALTMATQGSWDPLTAMTLSAPAALTLQNGAVINNGGAWTMSNLSSINQGVGAQTAFNNTLGSTLTVPTGVASINGTTFTNNGLVTGLGTLNFVTTVTNTGLWNITGMTLTGILINTATGIMQANDLTGLAPTIINAALTNNGILEVLAGSLTVNGVYTGNVGSSINVAGGTLTTTTALNTPTLNLTGGILNGTGALTVTNTFNRTIGTLGNTFASINITQAAGNLAVGSMGATGAVNLTSTAGTITVNGSIAGASINEQSATGITLGAPGILTASGAGDAIVLNAGTGNFINNAGAAALTTPAGRWLVYSANPALDTFGGLLSTNLPLWGSTYANTAPATVAAGNHYLFSVIPSLTATVNGGVNLTKTYGVTTVAPVTTITGLVNAALYGNVFTQEVTTGTGLATSAGFAANVHVAGGPYAVTAAGNVTAPVGYGPTLFNNVTLTVNPAILTASLSNVGVTKAYDGTTAAPAGFVPTYTIAGLLAGDTAALTNAGALYNNAHVIGATGLTVSGLALGGITTGANASVLGDYTLNGITSLSVAASITPATLTSTAAIGGALTKVYDGSNAATGATVTGTVLGGIAGDTLGLNFAPVTLAYNGTHVVGTNAIIATGAPTLTITSPTAFSLASDYTYTAPVIANAAASITPVLLTSTAAIGGALTKVYDGTNAATGATVTGTVLGGIAGDTLGLNFAPVTLAYNGAHVVGTNAIIATGAPTLTITSPTALSLASDYSFVAPVIANAAGASITPVLLTSTAAIGGVLTKVYDGTTAATGATLAGTVTGGIVSDTLSLNFAPVTLAYNGTHVVGTNAITATGAPTLTITSPTALSLAGDYTYTAPVIANAAASITPLALTSTATATIGGVLTKAYDGTTAAPGATLTAGGAITGIAGDVISLNTAPVTLNYNTSHVATANTISATGAAGFTIGASAALSAASDYSFVAPVIAPAAGASITPVLLTSTAAIGGVLTKVYDGTTAATGATLAGTVTGGIVGDILGLNFAPVTLAYNGINVVGTTAIVATGAPALAITSPTALSLASDYSFVAPVIANAAAAITPATLTVTANALSKTVGGIDPLLTFMTAGLVAPDTTATTLVGALARLAGETAGLYPVNQGTLASLSTNYTMSYVPANFSIVVPPVAAPVPAAAVIAPVVNTLVNNIIVIPPSVPFNPPTPPVITLASVASPPVVQTPATPAASSSCVPGPGTTCDSANGAAAVAAANPAPPVAAPVAAAPLPTCK